MVSPAVPAELLLEVVEEREEMREAAKLLALRLLLLGARFSRASFESLRPPPAGGRLPALLVLLLLLVGTELVLLLGGSRAKRGSRICRGCYWCCCCSHVC